MKNPPWLRVAVVSGVVLLALAGYGQFSGEAPSAVRETFEPAASEAPAAAESWRVRLGAAGVSAEASFAGAQALKIEPGEPPGRVEFGVPAELASGTFYVELRLLAGAPAADGTARPAVAVTGAQTGLVRVGADAVIQVFDASKDAWQPTETQWPATASGGDDAPTHWVKLTLRIERAAGTWSLWVDGAPVAANLPLDLAGNEPLTLFGASGQAVFVDNLYVGGDDPLQREVFENGGANPRLPGPGDATGTGGDAPIVAGGGAAALDPLDDPDADPDGDGLTNAQEEFFGTDKLRADHPAVGLVVFTPLQRSREQLESDRQRALARREALASGTKRGGGEVSPAR